MFFLLSHFLIKFPISVKDFCHLSQQISVFDMEKLSIKTYVLEYIIYRHTFLVVYIVLYSCGH